MEHAPKRCRLAVRAECLSIAVIAVYSVQPMWHHSDDAALSSSGSLQRRPAVVDALGQFGM